MILVNLSVSKMNSDISNLPVLPHLITVMTSLLCLSQTAILELLQQTANLANIVARFMEEVISVTLYNYLTSFLYSPRSISHGGKQLQFL